MVSAVALVRPNSRWEEPISSNLHAPVWLVCVTLAVPVLTTGCSAAAPAPVLHANGIQFQNVRFDIKPDEGLLTACRGDEPESYALIPGYTGRHDATEYIAPAGGSIKDASIAGDTVLAVVIRPQTDAHGNHPLAIASFPPSKTTMVVRKC